MKPPILPLADTNLPLHERIDRICDRFEADWRSGTRPRIEAFLTGQASERSCLLWELLRIELEYRLKAGEQPSK